MLAAVGTASIVVVLCAAGCGGPSDGAPPAAAALVPAPVAETEPRRASRDAGGAAVAPGASAGIAGDRDADRNEAPASASLPSRPAQALPQPDPDGGLQAFERFVAGLWYRLPDIEADSPDAPVEVIQFEPVARRITLFDGEVQEVYAWDDSVRLRSGQFDIRMRNALVTSIEKTMSVEVVADDEARLAIRSSDEDDDDDGVYRRLGETARRKLARTAAAQPGLAPLDLDGRYRGSDGEWIRFDPPRFTWQQSSGRLSGGFAVYSVDRLVIVFKVVAPAGTTREVRAYTLDYREQRGDDRMLRSLVLRPATLEIGGVTAVGATALHFEQVELIDVAEARTPTGDDR